MIKGERQSNFELLRIVCMVLILSGHYSTHGGILTRASGVNRYLAALLQPCGKLGVTAFVLISGYFMAGRTYRLSSTIRVALQTTFYAMLVTLVCLYIGVSLNGGKQELKKQFFAPIYGRYWFVRAYICMSLFSPFLNLVLERIAKRELIYLGVILSLIPVVFGDTDFVVNNNLWFCYLYLVGGYLRIRGDQRQSRVVPALFFAGGWLAMSLSIIVMRALSAQHPSLEEYVYIFSSTFSPFMLVSGLGLFQFFSRLRLSNRMINRLGSITFACYLVHDNPIERELLWKKLFGTPRFFHANALLVLLHIAGCIAVVFTAALLLEAVRKPVETRIFSMPVWERVDQWSGTLGKGKGGETVGLRGGV